jgi:signal transduction histidine kinase
MKRILCDTVVVAFLFLIGTACNVNAATFDEAKALAEKAAAFWKANGKEKAVAEINNPKGRFTKGELYVTAGEFTGLHLANGGNPKLAGINLLEQKDPAGKAFVKELIAAAKRGGDWVEYSWTNPATKKIQQKRAWATRVPGEDIYTACGMFITK